MIGAGDGSRKGVFAASLAIHVMLLGVFPLLISRFGGNDEPEPIDVVFYRQAEERPALVPPEPPAEPEPVIEVARVEPPKPEPRPEPIPKPRPVVRQAQQTPPPPPAPLPAPLPEKPRREVRTDLFAQAQQEPSPTPASRLPKKTRSAGFAAVEVEPAPRRERKNRAAARSGVFEVEPSPAENAPTATKRQRAVNRGGFGDEAPAATPASNTSQERGTVKTAGFGAVPAESATQPAGGKPASVSTGGFGDAETVAPAARRRDKPEESPDTPVEILSKPKPAYTAEARELKVEGEVVLKVVFDAAGKMRVLNIVEGLGHGLDEAAVEAAKEIEFKPAKRNGKPVDHTAVLRIVFQLA